MITLFKDPFFEAIDRAFDSNRHFNGPQTSIRKNESEYTIKISTPGLTKDDLKITTKEGVLNISFEREEKDDAHYFIGSFNKSYSIPENVKERDIVGKVENGILELILPIDKKKPLERLISLN